MIDAMNAEQQIEQRLVEIAKHDAMLIDAETSGVLAHVKSQIATLQMMVDDLEKTPSRLRDELRNDIHDYVMRTGDMQPYSSHITLRKTSSVQYDDKEMLQWLKDNDHNDFVRVRESIDKRALAKSDILQDAPVAETVKTLVVAISKPGDLLITTPGA